MLEIKISEKGTSRCEYLFLPLNRYEFINILDTARIFGEYTAEISGINNETCLSTIRLSDAPNIDELNFLAKRMDEICKDKCTALAYNAVISQRESVSIGEAITATYGLESVPVYPCSDAAEYGGIVLENEMLDELSGLPDEIYELLDREKIGKLMQEREGGVFLDGYYIIPSSYEPQLAYNEILPEQMEDWLFKLDVTVINGDEPNEENVEILTLPAGEERLKEIEERLGEPLADCVWLDIHSQIYGIDDCVVDSMENIHELNGLAKVLSEMPRLELAKFKAVLEKERPKTLSEISVIPMKLDRYEFEPSVSFMSAYGERYLSKILPPDFDKTLLRGEISSSFAKTIAARNGVTITDYGAVTGEGGHMYSIAEKEQTAAPSMSL